MLLSRAAQGLGTAVPFEYLSDTRLNDKPNVTDGLNATEFAEEAPCANQ